MRLPILSKIRYRFNFHRHSRPDRESTQKIDVRSSTKSRMTIGNLLVYFFGGLLFLVSIFFIWQTITADQHLSALSVQDKKTKAMLAKVGKELTILENQDQYKINQELSSTMSAMQQTYSQSVSLYEKLLDLKIQVKDTSDLDALFAKALEYLANKNYASASSTLTDLQSGIQDEQNKLAASFTIPSNTVQSNTPPGSGFSQQQVTADTGTFLVDIVAADLNSTRVLVDTASSSDCSNNCPVLPVGDYAARSGAYAAINGTFFCPADYPSCTGKTGSFDTLLMNKNKVYFNSANNVYSVVPAVIFSGNSARFVGRSLEWGRDTSPDSVIAMQPLLVWNNNINFSSSSDSKFTNKGTRDFIATKGTMVYIGVIFNANMTDAAHVLKAMGMENALNLDEGGSTALWVQGSYRAGPGRNVPNAVLFVAK